MYHIVHDPTSWLALIFLSCINKGCMYVCMSPYSFREKDNFPLCRGPVVKKKPLFSNARALITSKIMRSRDAQCNTGE